MQGSSRQLSKYLNGNEIFYQKRNKQDWDDSFSKVFVTASVRTQGQSHSTHEKDQAYLPEILMLGVQTQEEP